MATVQIELPDQLAQDAESGGILSPAAMEELLRKQLRARSLKKLMSAAESIADANGLPYMSPEEIVEEIAAMRAERRAAANS